MSQSNELAREGLVLTQMTSLSARRSVSVAFEPLDQTTRLIGRESFVK
jgi:hypothetical protein